MWPTNIKGECAHSGSKCSGSSKMEGRESAKGWDIGGKGREAEGQKGRGRDQVGPSPGNLLKEKLKIN